MEYIKNRSGQYKIVSPELAKKMVKKEEAVTVSEKEYNDYISSLQPKKVKKESKKEDK
jgi:hypothetical protein